MNGRPWSRADKLAVFICLGSVVFLVAACGAATKDPEADRQATTQTQPAPEPPDTGRMSDGEFTGFKSGHERFQEEVSAYGEGLTGKCATIAAAGQAAEFFDCEDEAFDGVVGAYSVADEDMKNLRADVAKGCRTSLARTRRAFNNFADAVVGTHDLASKGQLSGELVGAAAGQLLTSRRKTYQARYRSTLRACEPR